MMMLRNLFLLINQRALPRTLVPANLLVPLIAALGLLACSPDLDPGVSGDDDDGDNDDDDGDDDDDDMTDPAAVLESIDPEQDETDVPVTAVFALEFDRPPGAVEWDVVASSGETVAMTIWVSTDETSLEGDPVEDLTAGETYRVSIAWGPNAVSYEFSTLEPTDPSAMEAVVDVVYVSALLDGEFTEPAGAGAIIQGTLDPISLMVAIREETEFAVDVQPSFHMIAALGQVTEAGVVEQAPCSVSIAMTAGPDATYGTEDDVPGTFEDGSFELGPTEMAVSAQGTAMVLREVELRGSYLPSLAGITAMTLSGIADTRPLDPLLGNGEEGSICTLLFETAGIECFECGAPVPGSFCLDITIEELTAAIEPGAVIQERTCADVITSWTVGGVCHPEALAFDDDGNGTYELCPEYSE